MRRKGRRIVILVAAIFMFLTLSLGGFAFQNEPEGFVGLKWGDPPREDMELLVEGSGFLIYFIPDNVVIGKSFNGYIFWKGRFCGVIITFKGEESYEFLKKFCRNAYGEWYDVEKELNEGFLNYKLRWTGQKSFIDLLYDTQHEQGSWLIRSTVIMREKEEAEKAAGGFGFQNEPDGFRGLKRGDPPAEGMEKIIDEKSELRAELGSTKYIRPSDKLSLGNIELDSISYCFYYDRFVLVELRFSGKSNYELMKEICRERFGKETRSELYRLKWFSSIIPGISVELGYNYPGHPEEEGFLSLANLKMYTEIAFMKAKEKAEGDW